MLLQKAVRLLDYTYLVYNTEPPHPLLPQLTSLVWFTLWKFISTVAVEATDNQEQQALLPPFSKKRNGKYDAWTKSLPLYPPSTNQRAEITAIILTLEQALEKLEELDTNPYLDVKIYSDSRYAIGCITNWIYKWTRNGWINAAGNEVANRDLIQEASHLDNRLKEVGDVEYIWISREENQLADRLCNKYMDNQ